MAFIFSTNVKYDSFVYTLFIFFSTVVLPACNGRCITLQTFFSFAITLINSSEKSFGCGVTNLTLSIPISLTAANSSANDNDIKALLNDIRNDYTNIDCLINCAGMWISGDMSKLEQPIFDEMNSLDRIKKVIDTIGGEIAVESKIGKGSTFIIKLNKD